MFLKHNFFALLWALLILILCAIPGHDIPYVSFLELLNFDKLVHASLFFVLAFLLIRGFQLQHTFALLHKFPGLMATVLCILYGAVLEILQGLLFIERSADIYDFIANAFGSIMGFALFNKLAIFVVKYFKIKMF